MRWRLDEVRCRKRPVRLGDDLVAKRAPCFSEKEQCHRFTDSSSRFQVMRCRVYDQPLGASRLSRAFAQDGYVRQPAGMRTAARDGSWPIYATHARAFRPSIRSTRVPNPAVLLAECFACMRCRQHQRSRCEPMMHGRQPCRGVPCSLGLLYAFSFGAPVQHAADE